MGWTTTDLLESIKDRAAVPADQTNFPDSKLLTFADEETRTHLMPAVIKYRDEWLTYEYDYSLTTAQDTYRLPSRAYGGKLRLLTAVDAVGVKHFPQRITPERAQEFTGGVISSSTYPTHYYMKHGSVVVEPVPSVTAGTLRMTYYRRPSDLVATSAVATVSAIDTTTKVVTLTGIPTSFISTNIISQPYDFIRAKPEFDGLSIDITPTATAPTTVTLSSVPTDLAVGDYMALAGKTPIPQIPADLHPVLAQMVACRVLASLGFIGQLQAAKAELKEMLESAGIILQTRDEGSGLKVVPRVGVR